MCVRKCDGYFWPISFATTPKNFAADRWACENSCEAPVKLFVYANPGGDTPDLVDLSGRPYSAYPFAWRYQSKYDPQCKCVPHPWEVAAIKRHRRYARQNEEENINRHRPSISIVRQLGDTDAIRAVPKKDEGAILVINGSPKIIEETSQWRTEIVGNSKIITFVGDD